jgi:hypothetical protein
MEGFKDLKGLWEALQDPAAQAFQDLLLSLREQAMGELLESNDWNQFLETRAGIRVIDEMLELRTNVATEIVEAEDARRHDAGEYDS